MGLRQDYVENGYIDHGQVRLVHAFGGPEKTVTCCKNGGRIFIYWEFNGLIEIILNGEQAGHFRDKPRGLWRMHPEDFDRISGRVPVDMGKK